VIGSLKADPSASAIGMWKGADEPWKARLRPAWLRFAYCLATGRGRRSWCAGRTPLDRNHLWVTVQAARAGVWSLEPYSAVTDVHGVNQYPIAIGDPDPDLGQVGLWTDVLRWATPSRSVWTTHGLPESTCLARVDSKASLTLLEDRSSFTGNARNQGAFAGHHLAAEGCQQLRIAPVDASVTVKPDPSPGEIAIDERGLIP